MFSEIFPIFLNFLKNWWWAPAPLVLFFIFKGLWLDYIRGKYLAGIAWTLLEVRIPKEILKTPQAMEQVFSGLHGILSKGNWVDRNIEGKVQLWFSFEIVGIGGQTHFFIRTPSQFRNLVEAQIYAQYPGAEISEADDYTNNIPSDAPNKYYDLWGTELILQEKDAYPIRTWREFAFSEKEVEAIVDPLAAMTEVLSKLRANEQIWIQLLIKPIPDDWKKEGAKIVYKLIGKKIAVPTTLTEDIADFLYDLLRAPFIPPPPLSKPEGGKETMMQHLSPGEKGIVEAIELNLSKIGFECSIRFIYFDSPGTFSRANVAAVVGVFKQFNALNLNGFKPNGKVSTSIDYFFKKTRLYSRKRKIFDNYKERGKPEKSFIFNIEELATIYHFPGRAAGAPLMPRIEAKKGEPPINLPIE